MFLQEECCYYINESGLVEENTNTLHHLQEDLRKKQNTGVLSLSWWHPMLTWLTPVITPIIVICSYKLVCEKLDEWTSTKCFFIPSSGSQLRHQPTDLSSLLCPYSAGSSQKEPCPLSIIKRSE
ncbi:Endogenous retrovirus group FC1 Env polyprotein, partial [Plecturocebus cupreus]